MKKWYKRLLLSICAYPDEEHSEENEAQVENLCLDVALLEDKDAAYE